MSGSAASCAAARNWLVPNSATACTSNCRVCSRRGPTTTRFIVEGADASPTGTVRTTPARGANVQRARVAVAGCQAYTHGWYDAYAHLAREPDLDAVFHYGDYIYETGGGRPQTHPVFGADGNVAAGRDHFGGEIYSLDDYRRRYAQYKSDEDLQAAHAAAAFIMSFDDHEIDNDWGGEWDQDRTPTEVFTLRKYAAMQAWYENLPVRRAQFPRADGSTRYFRRLDYGNLMRMHVLDTRSYRNNQICNDPLSPKCRHVAGQPSSILGVEQEAWLGAGLRNESRWNLLAQQVFVMPLKSKQPDGQDNPPFVDKWDGYPGSRQRLADMITGAGLTNVVFATGDAHMNAVGEVPLRDEERGGPAMATEFLATSISSNGDGGVMSPSVKRFADADNPFLKLVDNLRGYHLHEITPDRLARRREGDGPGAAQGRQADDPRQLRGRAARAEAASGLTLVRGAFEFTPPFHEIPLRRRWAGREDPEWRGR